MKIGAQLKEKRKQLGLSVPELAGRMGIGKFAKIYKWEKGSNPSEFDEMKKVDDFLKNGLENFPEMTKVSVKIRDAGSAIIDSEIEILAYDRVILSTLAEVPAHLKKLDPDKLKEVLISKVDGEREEIANELKPKV